MSQRKPTKAQRLAQSQRDKSRRPKKNPKGSKRGRKGGFDAVRLGRRIGSLFGPTGSSIGATAGELFRNLTGFGDYKVNSNTLSTNMDSLPSFGNVSRGTRVTHREYLFDVITSSTIGAFSIEKIPLQPALLGSFPWLSAIAENYQQYELNGVVYEFKSNSYDALSSTNTASGTVVMATNYNVYDPDFTNKFVMEQTQYTCSGKPSRDLLHPIECAKVETPTNIQYTRSAVTTGDLRLYDWGNFYVATVGMQGASTNIGELWVTYDITLYKPKLNSGVDVADHWLIPGDTAVASGPNYFGLSIPPPVLTPDSDIGTTLSGTTSDGITYYSTINFPEGYTGKVILFYYMPLLSTASATLDTPLVLVFSGGVSYITCLADQATGGNQHTDAGQIFVYNGNGGLTYVAFLNVINGGSVQFTGGSSTTTTDSGDLIIAALPTVFGTDFGPVPPSLLERRLRRRETSRLSPFDELDDLVSRFPKPKEEKKSRK